MKLKQKYLKQVVPAMKEKFDYKNKMAVPRLEKAMVNVGIGKGLKDAKFIEAVKQTLTKITGQKPIARQARKSIAGFKIRVGQTVGFLVTLRGGQMYDFVDKLINIVLPRTRDFRGIPLKSVDGSGNLSIGFKEHLAFPEIEPDKVEVIHGLEVIIVTSTRNREKSLELLKLLGIPFREK
jgi:large subunit ribosomal protein L5